jgi:hypothetical protein
VFIRLDIAPVRGVVGGDRMALINSLTAVPDRQPATVSWATSQLERLRDRAVSALAYEFAARVQAEIKGLGWISSPQRVTSMDAANLTISGWSAGMLARLRVRDGRLQLVAAAVQPRQRRPGAGRHPGSLDGLRPAQRRTGREPGSASIARRARRAIRLGRLRPRRTSIQVRHPPASNRS